MGKTEQNTEIDDKIVPLLDKEVEKFCEEYKLTSDSIKHFIKLAIMDGFALGVGYSNDEMKKRLLPDSKE